MGYLAMLESTLRFGGCCRLITEKPLNELTRSTGIRTFGTNRTTKIFYVLGSFFVYVIADRTEASNTDAKWWRFRVRCGISNL